MLKIIAIFTAKEGHEEALFASLAKLIEPTRAEAGCFHYDLYRDPSAPGRFVFDESWESEAHLEAHRQTPHLTGMRNDTKDILASRQVYVLERAV